VRLSYLIGQYTNLSTSVFTPGSHSFCKQVSAFANAKIVIGHHGAEIAGNYNFAHPSAIIIEITPMENPKIGNSLFPLKAIQCGAALSTTTNDCRLNYFHNGSCLLDIDEKKVTNALVLASKLLNHSLVVRKPKSGLFSPLIC
jgi:hypothetical protein